MICSDIWHKYPSHISKLLNIISRAVRRVKFETILKYHKWYLCQISRTNHAIICLYYYPQKVVIFTCRYFKLSWNTTALSQSNCRNFSCSSIKHYFNKHFTVSSLLCGRVISILRRVLSIFIPDWLWTKTLIFFYQWPVSHKMTPIPD